MAGLAEIEEQLRSAAAPETRSPVILAQSGIETSGFSAIRPDTSEYSLLTLSALSFTLREAFFQLLDHTRT
jgi:hypothetical protein